MDKYGFCIKCHKDLMTDKVIGGKVVRIFLGDKDETEFLLDDDSKMRVTICRICKDKLTPDDEPEIMKEVVAGWQAEMGQVKWSENDKKDYMDRYSKRKIICRSENVPLDVLDKKKEKNNGNNNKK